MLECLVGLTLLAIMGAVAIEILIGGFVQFARNIALNQSAEQARSTVDQVLRRTETTADDPQLISLTGSPAALVQAATSYAQGIRFHRMIGGAYQITGPIDYSRGGIAYTSAETKTLSVSYSSASPTPKVGDRLLFLNPSDIKETVTGGTSPGLKPGRKIVAVGVATGSNPVNVTVTLESAPGKPLVCSNPCHVVREAAFVAVDQSDRRELRYYDNTANLINYVVLSRELDRDPQHKDASGKVIQPFALVTVDGRVQVLFDLPIRVKDFRATLSRVGTDDEFHSFLRTGTQIVLRTNLSLR